MLQHRRADPAVIADRDLPAAGPPEQRREAAPDRARVLGPQRLADDAANIVFPKDRGVELVTHARSVLRRVSSPSSRSRAELASCTCSFVPPRSGWTCATSRLCASMMSARLAPSP